MRLKLAELQESDTEAQKIKIKDLKVGLNKYVNIKGVLQHHKLLFVLKII